MITAEQAMIKLPSSFILNKCVYTSDRTCLQKYLSRTELAQYKQQFPEQLNEWAYIQSNSSFVLLVKTRLHFFFLITAERTTIFSEQFAH